MGGVDFWFIVLVLIFSTIPLLRIHAVYVLFKARGLAKDNAWLSGALTERLIVASTGAIGSTLLALIGLNRVFGFVLWGPTSPVGFIILVIALMLFSVPAFVWEYMYLTGRLEK